MHRELARLAGRGKSVLERPDFRIDLRCPPDEYTGEEISDARKAIKSLQEAFQDFGFNYGYMPFEVSSSAFPAGKENNPAGFVPKYIEANFTLPNNTTAVQMLSIHGQQHYLRLHYSRQVANTGEELVQVGDLLKVIGKCGETVGCGGKFSAGIETKSVAGKANPISFNLCCDVNQTVFPAEIPDFLRCADSMISKYLESFAG